MKTHLCPGTPSLLAFMKIKSDADPNIHLSLKRQLKKSYVTEPKRNFTGEWVRERGDYLPQLTKCKVHRTSKTEKMGIIMTNCNGNGLISGSTREMCEMCTLLSDLILRRRAVISKEIHMVDKEEGNKDKFKLRHGKPGRNKTNTVKEMD